jgi:AraC family transcriptional regulator of adaptative response / DNA-3-methyladenine glycosylase II
MCGRGADVLGESAGVPVLWRTGGWLDEVRKMGDSLVFDHHACYEGLLSHDARFDGRIFVGCTSTGIYCRPICRVRTPRKENCRFFPSAAAAEAQGFRPCLKCRPELAPGLAPTEASSRLARQAALLMEEDCLPEGSIEGLARTLGVTGRHLRRVFEREFGVSPVEYLQTRRLLLAKGLLTDTALPITQIALAAGFKSIRRFNDLFRERYRMTPGSFRKGNQDAQGGLDSIRLHLGYRAPYEWGSILGFLGQRTIDGVETVRDGSYQRAVCIQDGIAARRGWLTVTDAPSRSMLIVTVSAGLLPVLSRVLARVRGLFDLNCDPARVAQTLGAMNALGIGSALGAPPAAASLAPGGTPSTSASLAPGGTPSTSAVPTVPEAATASEASAIPTAPRPWLFVPGVRVPGCFDPFEMAVRAVLGQQVTVKAARTLAGRLVTAFGTEVQTPFEGITHAFCSPQAITALPGPIEDALGPLGITGARARSIRALAAALQDGSIELSATTDAQRQMRALLELPGFGPWTVQYVALRALGWPDAFPHTDYGIKKALAPLSPREIEALSQSWRPWRSYATISLWNSLAAAAPQPTSGTTVRSDA